MKESIRAIVHAMRVALFVILLSLATAARAQDCPRDNPNGPPFDSVARTLTGKVIFHDDLRGWLGLKLAAPVCGSKEIQLLPADLDTRKPPIDIYRGCNVTTQGTLGIPTTGYYSAEIYQIVGKIAPSPGCILRPPFPDYSKAKPSPSVRSYRVSMRIDYGTGHDHPAVVVRSGDKPLAPWQAYARYMFTGGYVFYAYCADDFDLTHFSGTPEAKPWLIDNQIAMDPETAAIKHITHLRLDYTCHRSASSPQ